MTLQPTTSDWRLDALCAQVDTELFFPDQRGGNFAAAKRICRSCPVAATCLEVALSVPAVDDWGIWGGLSQRERARIRTERRAQAAADGAA